MRPARVPQAPSFAARLSSVGCTGTNGKTTTTGWIAAALGRVSKPVARVTTLGFYLDDAHLAAIASYDDFARGMQTCVERGGTHAAVELTSEALAAGFARAWPFKVGVFTNLSHDHLDAHGSFEHYLASKAQLFMALPPGGTAVLNASDDVFELLREVVPACATLRSYAVASRGAAPRGSEPDLVATSVEIGWRGTTIRCDVRDPASGLPAELRVRGIGAVYAENALAALLGAVAAGVAPSDAAAAIADCPAPTGRFEVIHERPWVVIDYAHSPDALARTVAAARELAHGARLITVFGAGGKRDKAKRAPMGEAARPSDVVFLTSDNPRDEDPAAIADAVLAGLTGHADVRRDLDRRSAIHRAIAEAGADDVILIAGKGHETTQTIAGETREFSDAAVAREKLTLR